MGIWILNFLLLTGLDKVRHNGLGSDLIGCRKHGIIILILSSSSSSSSGVQSALLLLLLLLVWWSVVR